MSPAAIPRNDALPPTAPAEAQTVSTASFTSGQTPQPDPSGVTHLPPRALKATKSPKVTRAPHTVLISLRPGADPAKVAATVQGQVIETLPAGYIKINIKGTPEAAIRTLGKNQAVRTASLDRARYADATPNDTYYATYQKYLATVRMPQAWGLQQSATGAVIAVVDTGVDATHPDLNGRVLAGYNTVTNTTTVTDTEGHGTMVAGIAAANTNNALGIAGVAWNGRILPVKVFTGDVAYDSDVAEGITWAADHGAKIINLSLGGPDAEPVLRSAIQYAIGKGALVVASAGNTGDNSPHYPGSYPEVLTVGATDVNANLVDFSTWGDGVDIAAPGWNISSTYSRNTTCGTSCQYATSAGTSFSAPIVSGVAALLKTRSPSLTPSQITDRLTLTARDAGPRGIDPYYGHGVLDAYAALGGAATTDFPQHSGGAYEPNDVPARAVPFVDSISATFGMEGDVDWYRYTVTAIGTWTFTVTAAAWNEGYPQNADPVMEIYDSELRLLQAVDAAGPGGEETASLALMKGDYFVKVRNANGAVDTRAYSLSARDGGALYFPLFTDRGVRGAGQSFQSRVAIGDVTGDGRADAILTNSDYFDPDNDYKLFVYPQLADGTLGEGVRYDTHLHFDSNGGGIAILDANGDGRKDIALAEQVGVEILLQKADGTLDAGVLVPGTTDMLHAVSSDIDHDGDDDLITLGVSGLELLKQGPAGQFTAQTIAADMQSPDVRAGDLNNDGRLDIVVADLVAYKVQVYLQGADGSWTNQSYPFPGSGTAYGMDLGDVTGDGRADVLLTNWGDPLVIYPQQPDGRLGTPHSVAAYDSYNTSGVTVADWDQDGLNDIFLSHPTNDMSFFHQSSPGTLEREVFGPPPTANLLGPQRFALGDLNSDGYPDFVATPNSGGWRGIQFGYNPNGSRQFGPQEWVKDTSIADFSVLSRNAIRVTMQRPLLPSSVTGETVKVVDGLTGATVSLSVRYDAASKTIRVIGPEARLRTKHPYRVIIGPVKDLNGNTFGGYSFTFTR